MGSEWELGKWVFISQRSLLEWSEFPYLCWLCDLNDRTWGNSAQLDTAFPIFIQPSWMTSFFIDSFTSRQTTLICSSPEKISFWRCEVNENEQKPKEFLNIWSKYRHPSLSEGVKKHFLLNRSKVVENQTMEEKRIWKWMRMFFNECAWSNDGGRRRGQFHPNDK